MNTSARHPLHNIEGLQLVDAQVWESSFKRGSNFAELVNSAEHTVQSRENLSVSVLEANVSQGGESREANLLRACYKFGIRAVEMSNESSDDSRTPSENSTPSSPQEESAEDDELKAVFFTIEFTMAMIYEISGDLEDDEFVKRTEKFLDGPGREMAKPYWIAHLFQLQKLAALPVFMVP